MVGKISSGKSGGIQYLEDGKDINRTLENGEVITRDMMDHRVVLSGDIQSTKVILKQVENAKNYTKDYYHLTFSFKEDLEIETMQEILKEAEDFYLSGYNESEYNIYSEAHIAKDEAKYKLQISSDGAVKKYRLMSEEEAIKYQEDNPDSKLQPEKRYDHFHIIIPKINLVTNTQLKISEKDEVKSFNAFQEYINIKYELTSPKDLKRDISDKQFKDAKYNPDIELSAKNFSDLTNAQTKKTLIEMVEFEIQNEKISSYEEMKNYLESLEFIESLKEVSTSKNQYIKIKIEGQEKNVNLRNAIFTKDFYENKEIDFAKETRRIEGKSLSDYRKIIDDYKSRRVEEVSKRYDYAREKAIKENLIEKALNEKFGDKTISNTSTKKILKDLEEGKSIFLTGGAGVGKSFTANEIIREYEKEGKEVIKLGSTGLAALNVNGQTLHSFLKIGIFERLEELKESDEKDSEAYQKNIKELKEKLADSELIVIDEISMVSAEQMRMIEHRLKEADYQGKIMFVGDFFQLPPVAKDKESYYAFESKAWRSYKTVTHELTEIKRSDNKEFAELLNRLRYGKLEEVDLKILRSMQNEHKIDEDKSTYIFSTNKAVNEHNKIHLGMISGELYTYKSLYKSEDDLSKEDLEKLFKEVAFDRELELKKGARVLLSVNDRSKGFANGDKGVFEGVNEEGNLLVRLDRNGEVVEIEKRTFTAQIDNSKSFTVTNFPVKLAYAITTHKSQGMSIENLAISPDFQFEKNQFYVALSRAKDPKTTKILQFSDDEREVRKHRYDFRNILLQDNKVIDFYHPTLRSKEQKEFDEEIKIRQKATREKWKKEHLKEKDDIKTKAKRAAKERVKTTPIKDRKRDKYKKIFVRQIDKLKKELQKSGKNLSKFAKMQLTKIDLKERLERAKKAQKTVKKDNLKEKLEALKKAQERVKDTSMQK
jgi:hypothetical protein